MHRNQNHAGLMPQSLRATIGRKTIAGPLFHTTLLESQESYLTTGMLPYKHSRFFPQYARLYNAAASPASRLRSAGLGSLAITRQNKLMCRVEPRKQRSTSVNLLSVGCVHISCPTTGAWVVAQNSVSLRHWILQVHKYHRVPKYKVVSVLGKSCGVHINAQR